MPKFKHLIPMLLAVLSAVHVPSTAQAETASDVIRYRLEQLHSTGHLSIGDASIVSVKVLPELYERRRFAPLWTNSDNVDALLKEIRGISTDGLDPEDYHHSDLVRLQTLLQFEDGPEPYARAEFDMLLTDALICLGYHLRFGKVEPDGLDPHWNLNREIDGRGAVSVIEETLAAGNLNQQLQALRPQRAVYGRLKAALAKYRSIAAGGGWQPISAGPAMKRGMTGDRVRQLRKRLAAGGDLTASDPESLEFDGQLEQAVIRFQNRHGLPPDGIFGVQSLRAANVTPDARIDQIRVNLERARWILHALKGRFVLVDIAGFNVYLFDDDRLLWSARVQVGKPYRKTPVFRDEISYLEFNPTWTIPPTILNRDILPAVKKNPRYLQERNIRLLDQKGKTVDSGTMDWSLYPNRPFPYTLRQDPGPDNALGQVKFMFPNSHMVYLHDTPSKSLFAKTSRTSSSGCIRVERPFELAELLLNNPRQWNQKQIMTVVESGKTRVVYLDHPVPVLLLYWTVHVEENGTVYFREDIYDRDQGVLAGLGRRFSLRENTADENRSLPPYRKES
jgi:murein L,D-transpeptidase YcbB/YkuD